MSIRCEAGRKTLIKQYATTHRTLFPEEVIETYFSKQSGSTVIVFQDTDFVVIKKIIDSLK